jgi:hypothetical protein
MNWKGNTETSLRDKGWEDMDYNKLAFDGVYWKTFVNMVMDLQKARNF